MLAFKVLIGIFFSVFMLWIYALLLFFTSLSDEYLRVGVFIALFLGITFLGFLICIKDTNRCFFYGGRGGLIFGIVVTIINIFFAQKFVCLSSVFIFLLGAYIFGGIGGIFGRNIKN